MKTSSAKAKGRNLQKWVVARILDYFPFLSPLDVRSTSMGAQGIDIQLSKRATEQFPWAVECKNQEKLKQIYDMWHQAITNSSPDVRALLVLKMNHEKPLVVLDFEDFMKLCRKVYLSDV